MHPHLTGDEGGQLRARPAGQQPDGKPKDDEGGAGPAKPADASEIHAVSMPERACRYKPHGGVKMDLR